MRAMGVALLVAVLLAQFGLAPAAERPPQAELPSVGVPTVADLDFRRPGSRSRAIYEGPRAPGSTEGMALLGRVSWLKIVLPSRPSIFGNVLFNDDARFNAQISFERDLGRTFFEVDLNRNALGAIELVGLRLRDELSDAGQILIGTSEPIGIDAFRFWLWPGAAESNRGLISANLLDILIRFDDGQYATLTIELDDDGRQLMQFVLEDEAVRLLQ